MDSTGPNEPGCLDAIRVNQGMSYAVNERALYQEVTLGSWQYFYHSTTWDALSSILIEGFLPGGHHGRGHRRHVMASPYHPNHRLHTRSSRDNMAVVITIDVEIALKLNPGSWWWTDTSVV